jgi:3-hydroxyisobutyrate dehydrogenase
MPQTVAFIGLGVMGSPMARNLVKGGYTVKAWNRTPDRPLVQQAKKAGVVVVSTIAEAVQDADTICICVSDVVDVNEVLFQPGGIAANAPENSLIIDFSTIGAAAARDIAQKLSSQGLRFLDAPISGGDVGAQKGTLTIMVGGSETDFNKAQPLLETMGKNIIHCGDSGSGQAVKLCNQVLCSVHMVALCEAMQLAKQLDINPDLVVEVCSTGAAGSWALSNLGEKVAHGDFAPGFMIKHILKDLRLVQENIGDGDLDLPGTAFAQQQFQAVQDLGGAQEGTQAMIRAYTDQ